MAKKKNENNQGPTQEQAENQPEQNNNEEINAENTNEENKENNPNPKGVIVLGVYMHCQGCADKIVKYLRGFDGVEQIETNMKNHTVTVKGEKADPKKILERLRKKSNKHVKLISPILKEKKEENKEAKKQEVQPKVVEVVLKIYMHCEGCSEDIKYRIHKMQGVMTVDTDMNNSQVTVKGMFEPNKLVEYINKRAGKHAVIMKQTLSEKKKDDENKGGKKEQKEKDGEKIDLKDYYQIYPPGLVYAPQLFSDENPNACSVM
ncbi:unnamed protein product [Camellia sinensis]